MSNDNSDADLHRLVWDELPWLVNGSATVQQRDRAQGHLAQCVICREERQRQQQFLDQMQAGMDHIEAGQLPDVERGLAHLLAQLPPQCVTSDVPVAVAGNASPARSRRMSWLGAVALAQAAAIGVMALGLVFHERDPADYRSLSAPAAVLEVAGPRWRVLPAEDMSLGEWRALLDEHELRVLGGPNSAGAWELGTRKPAEDGAQMLRRLRQQARLRLVEPLAQP